MFSTPDGRARNRAASLRRSVGPNGSRAGTPVAGSARAGGGRSMTPRAGSVSLYGADESPVSSIRRGKSAYGIAAAAEAESRVLVRNESLTVDVFAELPAEVQEMITHTDLYTNVYRSSVRHDLGYACLIGRDACWVWSIARRTHTATAFTFPCPPLTGATMATASSFFAPTPYGLLLQTAKGREPALLLVAPGGAIRLWQAISLGLSGPARFSSAQLQLAQGEIIKDVLVITRTLLFASTSTSRLFRISMHSVGGQMTIRVSSQPLDVRNQSSVWKFLPSFGSTGTVSATDGVFSLALSPPVDSRRSTVWALEKDTLTCIDVENDGTERMRAQINGLVQLVVSALGAPSADAVQVLDFDVNRDGDIILLVSSIDTDNVNVTAPSDYHVISLSTDLASLDRNGKRREPRLLSCKRLGYTSLPDLRPLSQPKLKLISGGPLAYVLFADVIVLTSTLVQSALNEIIPLKATAGESRNRFFGADQVPSPVLTECSAVSAASGILRIRLTENAKALEPEVVDDAEMITAADAQSAARLSTAAPTTVEGNRRQTDKLRAKLEQAVYFGESADNPLAFDAAIDDAGGDLGRAALDCSQRILTSSSQHLENIIDTRNQLATRASRLQALMIVLHERNLFGKLAQSARRQLMWNAEKLAAAAALWTAYNASLSSSGSHGNHLVAVVDELLLAAGHGASQDAVRDYLRGQVPNIEHLVHQSVSSAHGSERTGPQTLVEAASIVITIYAAVERFRNETSNVGLYGVDDTPLALEPWTSRVTVVDDLLWLFDALRTQWQAMSKEASQQAAAAALTEAIDGLADFVLEVMRERMVFLTASRKDSNALKTLQTRFEHVKPVVVRSLVDVGRPQRAYSLAERFADFRSLVELSTDTKSGSEQQIHLYIEKYGEAFAFPLYNYFIEKGQSRRLLEQPEVYARLVLAFFQQADLPRLSWLHDIALRRYEATAQTLLDNGPKASLVAEQYTMLSISKLAFLATLANREVLDSDENLQAREIFDDRLDFTISQLDIEAAFREILQSEKPPPSASADAQARMVTSNMTTALEDRRALQLLYQSFVRRLLRGLALSPEDMMDLYTLSDDESGTASRMIQALQLYVRYQPSLPRGRAELALTSIWRRIYISTDWLAFRKLRAGASDEDIAAALESTPLFKVMAFIVEHRHHFEMHVRRPTQSVFDAGREVFDARFESNSAQEIEQVRVDYEHESEILQQGIEEGDLETCFAEVGRMVTSGGNDGMQM